MDYNPIFTVIAFYIIGIPLLGFFCAILDWYDAYKNKTREGNK